MIDVNDPIIVLGHAGQVGCEMVMALRDHGYTNVIIPIVDIRTASAVLDLAKYHPKMIINCAAYTDVDKAETDREQAFLVNAKAVGYLGMLSFETNCPIIHFSTDYVFDGKKPIYKVDDAPNPLSVYGESKLAGEQLLQLKTRGMEREPIILRTSWVFSDRRKNFFKTILKKSMELDTLKVVDDQYGRPTSAREIANQVMKILKSPKYYSGVFHLTCSGIATSWHGFAKEIVKQAEEKGYPIKAEILPCSSAEYITPVKRPGNSVLDTSFLTETYKCSIRCWENCLEELLLGLETSL